jgi:hypothetical protein
MVPDLPVELWLYILSMVPGHHLRKLIGINRTLFTMAIDEIYQEIRFINDDKRMLDVFQQLK